MESDWRDKEFIIQLTIFEQRYETVSYLIKNNFQMVYRKGWRQKNVKIQARRAVIQGSSTSELPGGRGKMLVKIPNIRFYPRSTELESLRARPSKQTFSKISTGKC